MISTWLLFHPVLHSWFNLQICCKEKLFLLFSLPSINLICYLQFDAIYGDAKGCAWRFCSFLQSYIPGVMNPHTKVVQQWNQFFVISCLVAIFVDPLSFFVLTVLEVSIPASPPSSFPSLLPAPFLVCLCLCICACIRHECLIWQVHVCILVVLHFAS